MSAVERTESAPQIDDAALVNAVVDPERGCGVGRYFTIPGRDPFDEIEWERRDAYIPGKDGPGLRAEGRRVSEVLVADCDEHRRPEVLPRPHGLGRTRVERQADDRQDRRDDLGLGRRGRLLR